MLRIFDSSRRPGGAIRRRELLRVGGLNALGLSLPGLLRARASTSATTEREPVDLSFGKARNVIFLWLQGGPPQHETFDPKPDAPAEVRGEFAPIATNVPGIQFSALLPRIATIADKLAIVRSMSTRNDLHDASGYHVLTGYKYAGRESRQISPTDWPYFGSIVKMLKPSETMPAFTSVWLPDVMRLNDNVQPAGQTAGFLGKRWDPERLICDPADPRFRIEGLELPDDVPALRLQARRDLLGQVEDHFRKLERGPALSLYDRQAQDAFGLLASGQARSAFDLRREPPGVRRRYGPGKWGQCLLLARRLVEAGVRLVHVNWPREGGDNAVDNPMWDTHAQNADRLQDVLCPQFDVGFTALIEDLEGRGLLNETLVVAIGEFGRTPKINGVGGRDHWGHVFSFAMAGGGIRTAQVHGSSDAIGAYPRTGKVEPQDLTATIFHLLGIGHDAFFPHPTGRPIRVTEGTPIREILGSRPATDARTSPGGNLALVPAYSEDLLMDTRFAAPGPLPAIGSATRLKGWQATPVGDGPAFGVRLVDLPEAASPSIRRHARIGFGAGSTPIPPGARALLAQEVRNPRAGRFTLSIQARGGGHSHEAFRDLLLAHFACRLVIFGFADIKKDPRRIREYASSAFRPSFHAEAAGEAETFTLATVLRSQDGGAMQLSRGVGIAIVLEKTTPGAVVPSAEAFLRIDGVELRFDPRPRDDEVVV